MPGFDGRGPAGRGGAGFGRGIRNGFRGQGGGFRARSRCFRGFGRGLGFCRFGAAQDSGTERSFLLRQKEWLQERLKAIDERLSRA